MNVNQFLFIGFGALRQDFNRNFSKVKIQTVQYVTDYINQTLRHCVVS